MILKPKLLFCLFASLLTCAVSLSAVSAATVDVGEAIKFPVERYQLENGLTVVLNEDHSAPILSYQQWFRVGSVNEKPGKTGLAHFFEHLMFKGTPKYPGSSYDRVLQANGGSNNAFTSRDYTGYYVNFPSDKLELAIDVESDRMRNLLFDPKNIKSEREVVKEERRSRIDNNVYGYLSEALYKTVFRVHPYRAPIAGSLKDLNSASIKDLKTFYNAYYAPNNAVIVISGDFKIADAKKLIKKYYSGIKRQKLPEVSITPEPEQRGHRTQVLKKSVQNPTFAVAYKGPKAGEDDAYALDLLASILADGRSSRMYKRFVYRLQTASSVSAWNYTPKYPGVFQVTVSVKPGKNERKVIEGIYAELYKARTKLVTDRELTKAKNMVMMSYVSGLKTVSGKARALASSEVIFGSYDEVFKEFARYQKVTKQQIKAAAEKYLTPQRRSLIVVEPKKTETAEQGA